MAEKIYYFSNLDNKVYNLNDLNNYNRQNDEIEILNKDGFVIDTVTLHTIDEIIDLIK